jgi:hypothetical protein
LSAELGVTTDAQVEAPIHGKWWLDGKTSSDKWHCQRAMCMIYSPEATNSGREIQAAKWIEQGGASIAVSPAEECVCLLNNPTRINGIKRGFSLSGKKTLRLKIQHIVSMSYI